MPSRGSITIEQRRQLRAYRRSTHPRPSQKECIEKKPVTGKEALAAIQVAIRFIESRPEAETMHLRWMERVEVAIKNMSQPAVQQSLTSWLSQT